MATGAVHELIHAREYIVAMRAADDFTAYQRGFYGCIGALRKSREAFHAMTRKRLAAPSTQQGTKSTPAQRAFETWWRRAERDPLMEWVKRVRDDDQHYNTGHLDRHAEIGIVRGVDFDVPDGAKLMFDAGEAWFVWDYFSVRERIVPAKPVPGTPSAQSARRIAYVVSTPPATHRGEPVVTDDPVELCEMSLNHIEWMMEEAESRWPRNAPDSFNSLRARGVGVWEAGSAQP